MAFPWWAFGNRDVERSNQDSGTMNRSGIHPLFLVGLLFVMASPVFWMHTHAPGEAVARSYENADLYQRIYPQFHYGFKRLHEGDLPLWNSGQLCGAPFQADPSSGLFQPLNLVFVWLPTEKALAIHGFVCLALMGLGMTLFARSQGLGYVASLVGASVYAFNGMAAGAVTRPGLAAVLV